MAERAKDIFLSYGREERVREFVKKLKVDLEANGVSVWLDVDDIPTGSDFHVEIGVALKSCRALIPVLTKRYVQSRYCKGELYVANSQKKVLLPVIYEDGWDEGDDGAGVNYIVAAFNWAFFRPNKDDYKTSLEKLVHGIKLKLQDSSKQPATTQKVSLATSMALTVEGVERWQELGHQLDVDPEKLAELLNSDKSVTECRDEMIAYWEKHDNDASWEKLARALSRMRENKLAERIIDEHVKKTSAPSMHSQEVQPNIDKPSRPTSSSGVVDVPGNNGIPDISSDNADVTSWIQEFEERFERLEFASLTELEEKQVDLKRFRHSLILLPAKIKKEHTTFLKENLPTISKAESIDEIFMQLNLYWNFIDYSLLEHIINRFCSEELKKDMVQYISDLEAFRKATTISQMIRSWPGRIEPPPHFSKVTCKLNRDASTYTLYELDQLRVRFCHEFSLSDSIMMLHSFIAGSVVVVWVMPSGSVPDLRMELLRQGSMNPEFFEEHEILSITVDDSCAYLYMPLTQKSTVASPTPEKHSNFYFNMTHSVRAWYDRLQDLAHQTEFITLSRTEIDAIVSEGGTNHEQRQAYMSLERRIDQVIQLYEDNGAMVHINGMSFKDFVTGVHVTHDVITSSMEFEEDTPDPYPWKEDKTRSVDNAENKVLRAYQRAINTHLQVFNGSTAVAMLKYSKKIKQSLDQLKHFSNLDTTNVSFHLSVTKWNDQIAPYPGMEFRGFVQGNVLRAVSQINTIAYYPYVNEHKSDIQNFIEDFFLSHILPKLKELENYVVDFFVTPHKIYVMKLSPLNTSSDSALFTWPELKHLFTVRAEQHSQFEFRTVTVAETVPNIFSGLQPSCAAMLEEIVEKQKQQLGRRGMQRRGYGPMRQRKKRKACVLS